MLFKNVYAHYRQVLYTKKAYVFLKTKTVISRAVTKIELGGVSLWKLIKNCLRRTCI